MVDAAAAHVLAQAILGAYVRRLRFGAGDEVEVSLLEVAIPSTRTELGRIPADREPSSAQRKRAADGRPGRPTSCPRETARSWCPPTRYRISRSCAG